MYRIFIVPFILLYQCGFINAQKANGIQFIVNPYLKDFGNLEKRYTIQDCETVFSSHKKYPSFEAGALYHHDFNPKWGWGVGLTWRYAKFESNYQFTVYGQPKHVINDYNTVSNVNYSILKFQISYSINKKLKLNSFFNIEVPISEKFNAFPNRHFSFGVTDHTYTSEGEEITHLQWNDIKIAHHGYDSQINITPEIALNYEIFNGFNISAGFRYKFWKSNYPIIQTTVEGFNGPENYNSNSILYLSEVNNKDFSVVFGLMYEIKRNKK